MGDESIDHADGDLVLTGRGTAPGRACAPVIRNHPGLDADAATGCILVARRASPDDAGRVLTAAGMCTLDGAPMSHVHLLAREFETPSMTLGRDVPVRMVDPGTEVVLSFPDVVGSVEDSVLCDGDVVLLDGDSGRFTIPGGTTIAARARCRHLHAELRAFAGDPDRDADAVVRQAVSGSGRRFVAEAGLRHGVVPAGERARTLIRALEDSGKAAREALDTVRAALLDEAAERSQVALEAIHLTEDPEAPARRVAEMDRRLAPIRARLADLGVSLRTIDADRATALDRAERRRGELRERVIADVRKVLEDADPPGSLRHDGVFRLVRRAGAVDIEPAMLARLEDRLRRAVAVERESAGDRIVVPLRSEGPPPDRLLVGGKAVGLLRALPVLPGRCGVPDGFVITTVGYRLHLVGACGERILAAMEESDPASIARAARTAILGTPVPDEVVHAVEQALSSPGDGTLAVRSSATVEDGGISSLAGQFDSFLGVHGAEAVVDRVRWVWASLWNEGAIRVLAAHGMTPLDARQAVMVHRLIDTRAAGVLWTRDPVGSPGAVVVNAHWGLGAGISQGSVGGDMYWVRRADGEPIAFDLGAESSRVVPGVDGTGTLVESLPAGLAGRPCLEDAELRRLGELARTLENATGRAQDVEFGFREDGRLFVFQVRRLTRTRG